MNETTRHHGSLEVGQPLNAIHTHQQRDVVKWPWVILAIAAIILAAWGLARRPSQRAIDDTRNIPTSTQRPAPADRTP